ncbi:peptide chain release factor N(5)-glutamine methyltransferase [Arenicella xantha]|uniref:Release factor glutamine methyltransferase n=1 Tax=Arenicella xantha TaxID=644221 RepID=A0A395JNA4_9GAMM|nr:peptide chain release factor N(5)-glutamine methyltransferase [Arenicella xantha]RBP52773.1 [protein release factor]-glutamine N5-methyltransferase [Arenicella xantha]
MTLASPTYQGLINDAAQQLHETSDTPRIDAEVLLQHIVQRNMAWIIAYGDTIATPQHIREYYIVIEQRRQGQPVAYLIGYRDFWTLTLAVSPAVLIPRPDTEVLVENALARLPENTPLNILDMGTGSGAIALSLGKERPLAQVLATDLMPDALQIARANAQSNQVDNVTFLLSNWCENIPLHAQFDLIASNPPYIEPDDEHLQQGDLRFEPTTALIATDHGLADLNTIVEGCRHYLKPNGWLILEHGYNQADALAKKMRQCGFSDIQLHTDLNNLPRCTSARLPHQH